MKLIRFGNPGRERPGLLVDGQLRDLGAVISDVGGDALLPETLARLQTLAPSTLPLVEGSPRLGPCVGNVGKVVCVGLNYRDHAIEANMTIPAEPILFLKPTSSIIGPNDDIEIPLDAEKTDWEIELGIVIGKPGKYVPVERALGHVAGYCVVNDLSERSFQLERGGQWDKGKGCDTFGPVGPWLVTPDEAGDPQQLQMWLEVNGKRFQNGNTRTMVFNVAYLIHYLSQFMTLYPGDIVSTGTPPGVGMGQKPPVYLKPGDTIRLGIDGLGEQQQQVYAWDEALLD